MIVTALFSDYDSAESAAHCIRIHLPSVRCAVRSEKRISSSAPDHIPLPQDALSAESVSAGFWQTGSYAVTGGLFMPSVSQGQSVSSPFSSRSTVTVKGSRDDIRTASSILRTCGGETVTVYGEKR